MKIGLNALYYREPATGISRYTWQLIHWLPQIDQTNEYVFFIREKYRTRFSDASGTFINVPEGFPWGRVFREPGFIAAQVREKQLDIFHSPHFIISQNPECRTVLTFHDLAVFEYPEFFPWFKRIYWNRTVPASVRLADHIIADSMAIEKKIKTYFLEIRKPVSVVPLGVDRIIFQDFPESSSNGIDVRKPYILFVGYISPRKNLIRLIHSFNSLVEDYSIPHELVLVGEHGRWEKKYYRYLQREIDKSGLNDRVHLPGNVPEDQLPIYYKNADMLVHPAFGEGFGLPVLEAMASGIPVIIADDASLPELAGDAGVVFDPRSVQSMTDAIIKVIRNDQVRENCVRKGLEQANEFNWEMTARKTAEVYEKVYETHPFHQQS